MQLKKIESGFWRYSGRNKFVYIYIVNLTNWKTVFQKVTIAALFQLLGCSWISNLQVIFNYDSWMCNLLIHEQPNNRKNPWAKNLEKFSELTKDSEWQSAKQFHMVHPVFSFI